MLWLGSTGKDCPDHGDVTFAVERYKNGRGHLRVAEHEDLRNPMAPKGLRMEGEILVCDDCAGVENLPPDCGDNSCLCAFHKHGMRTNGGCRCDGMNLRRAVRWWRQYALLNR
jgi:hypothetical protein